MMDDKVQKVCVIGAGVMGAGIAAQAANAGAEVVLLDIVPEGEGDRSTISKGALEKLKKAQPAAFMHKRFAKRITPGNVEDDLDLIKGCDWVIEAVIENPKIKEDLYARITPYLKPGAVLSSNTSTLPLHELTTAMSAELKHRFIITHFFNPPRYMRLLEIITGPDTDKAIIQPVLDFADRAMGKSIVTCKDTPGFIANRIGTYWLQAAVTEAAYMGIGVEEADAVLSRPAGIPRTGVFGLLDLVGLDLMPHILENMEATLPGNDAFRKLPKAPDLMAKMIADGYTGRKGKGGFYRLKKVNGEKIKEAINLQTGEYAAARRPVPEAAKASKKGGLRALLDHPSAEGRYATTVLAGTLAYAASLAGEVADDIESIDRAMRLGYNWKYGPFELIDRIGPSWFATKLELMGIKVPPILVAVGGKKFYRVTDGHLHQFDGGAYIPVQREEGVLVLSDIKRGSKPVLKNRSASVWDIGDGVACFEFTSKMNSINPMILWMMQCAISGLPKRGFKAMVIYNEGSNFSVGANIGLFLVVAKLHLWFVLKWFLKQGQNTFRKLKYAPFPVIGAPAGMALGGGCETLLHCSKVVAHAETYVGLVEVGVGIIPGWGGCKELLGRWSVSKKRPGGPMVPVMKAFETIAVATVAKSAHEAMDLQFLRPGDRIVMNRDRVLFEAKREALEMADDYTPPEPYEMNLPGPSGKTALLLAVRDFLKRGIATPHDGTISKELAWVLSGGETDVTETLTEDNMLKLERDAFMRLSKTPQSLARVEHMLKKGKPLRN